MNKAFFSLLLLSNIILISKEDIQCDGEIIENCIQCNTGEDSDSCATCEKNHFSFFNNLLCLACNDSIYGQVECEGNCIFSNYDSLYGFVDCEKNGCKEGYYNYEGMCLTCSSRNKGCLKCSFEVQENKTSENFTCLECDTESKEYRLLESGLCEKCYLSECLKCHYDDIFNESICDQCYEGYYLDTKGKCQSCWYNQIDNGYCYICSENASQFNTCYCNSGSIKVGEMNCLKCPENCDKCSYNDETKETECSKCNSYYALSSNKACIYCGDFCNTCSLNGKNDPICSSCIGESTIINGQCIRCEEGCSNCTLDTNSEYKKETKCTECRYNYALNTKNNTCTFCQNIPEIGGGGCDRCSYNETFDKYECLRCSSNSYAYINNTHQCLNNRDKEELYLYGCINALYDEKNDKYECLQCNSGYVQISNDKTCRRLSEIGLEGCSEVENMGTIDNPIYTCNQCKEDYTLIESNSTTGKKNAMKEI